MSVMTDTTFDYPILVINRVTYDLHTIVLMNFIIGQLDQCFPIMLII